MKASILAIGTELTTGQITNKNAAWISEKLGDLGIETVLHETVPDDRVLIRRALDACAETSDLLFITGGLGPTTDDFTREVISEWLDCKLQFHEPSWTKIVDRLTQRGIRVAESNRQQCFFPKESVILSNAEGTADGFLSLHKNTRLWVLPGPPREISSIWESHIHAMLQKECPNLPKRKLLSWQCLGKSEAELGEITEEALKGAGLTTGYRAHLPYVEIKVWVSEEVASTSEVRQAIERLEAVIAPWVATRGGKDLALLFVNKMIEKTSKETRVSVFDAGTGGFAAERIGKFLRASEYLDLSSRLTLTSVWEKMELSEDQLKAILQERADSKEVRLAVTGVNVEAKWSLGIAQGSDIRVESFDAPYKNPLLAERLQRYIAEMAFLRWREWIR